MLILNWPQFRSLLLGEGFFNRFFLSQFEIRFKIVLPLILFNLGILVYCSRNLFFTLIASHVSTFSSLQQLNVELCFTVFGKAMLWKYLSQEKVVIIKNFSVLDDLLL